MAWTKIANIKGPQGNQGTAGATGATGPQGVGLSPGTPITRTISFGTSYQASDPTKAAMISISVQTIYALTITLLSFTDQADLYIGSSSSVNTTGGFLVGTYKRSLTGLLGIIGFSNTDTDNFLCMLPVGWYFALRRVSGTTTTVITAYSQALT